MKKIFMASICAIMAVTAANADIASTTYVDGAIGDLDKNNNGTDGKYVFTVDTENGIAVPELKDFDPSVTDGSTSVNAPTTAAVASYVQDKLKLVTGDEGIAGLQSQIDEINGSDVMKSGVDADVVDKANSAVQSVVTGTTNGTISVDGADVAVKGLGSAAYTNTSAYATAAQGGLADSAVQSVTTGTANGTISVDNADVAVKGLGSAAYTNTSAYATAAQGTLADAALPAATLADAEMKNDGVYTLTMKKEGTVITYYWEEIGR